jgi:hypothetical protein
MRHKQTKAQINIPTVARKEMNHPTCPHCGYENDTFRDMCEVCEDETDMSYTYSPFYDGSVWDDVYESLENE